MVEDPFRPPGQEKAKPVLPFIEEDEDARLERGSFNLIIGLLTRPWYWRHAELGRDPRKGGPKPVFDPFKDGAVRHLSRLQHDRFIIAKRNGRR
jgi:hypothetical protein